MLTEISIENFAIIENLNVHFKPGLVTFTGETGAGKSIIIDAVETILGGRADATMVRSGSERAIIEAVFRIPEEARSDLHVILEREDLLDDPDYLSLGREIRLAGRNIARVNGRSVNVSLLREVGAYLIDVHGQSEHLSLLRVSQHLKLLDRYAFTDSSSNLQALKNEYQKTYRRLQDVQREFERILQSERDAARRADVLNYQINEIESARLTLGEDVELRSERNRLTNAEGLASLTQETLLALDEGTPEAPAATDLLGQVTQALTNLVRLDPSQTALQNQAQALFENLTELTSNVRQYLESIEFNPRRLDQVEERLALIHNLKHKYGDSISDVLTYANKARRQLDDITHAEERLEELESEANKLLQQLGQSGQALSTERHQAAVTLAQAVESELNDLNMEGARFQVDFQQRPDPEGILLPDGDRVAYTATGLERIEFLIAPNPGEGFKPLQKIASGGETSRLMLGMKNVLASADQVSTLIFDEIDQGIGGRAGTIVGQKLWQLGRQHQVLCITHLPQLAAFGEQHLHVEKQVQAGRTITLVKSLTGQERVVELAQMLGSVSDSSQQSAQELLDLVSEQTATQQV